MIKMVCMFYSAHCMNIIFNSLLAQFVKYDVHTTRKIKSIHPIITYYYFLVKRETWKKCHLCKMFRWSSMANRRLVCLCWSSFEQV